MGKYVGNPFLSLSQRHISDLSISYVCNKEMGTYERIRFNHRHQAAEAVWAFECDMLLVTARVSRLPLRRPL